MTWNLDGLNDFQQVSGAVILAIGAVIYVVYGHYSNFVYDSFQSAPLVLIIVGVIIFLVAFFGCCGACKENHCMIITVRPHRVVLEPIDCCCFSSRYCCW